jgi:hypothetical protein
VSYNIAALAIVSVTVADAFVLCASPGEIRRSISAKQRAALRTLQGHRELR